MSQVPHPPKHEQPEIRTVGPVLISGDVAEAIIWAIRQLNPEVHVQDRGSYIRVSVPQECLLTRELVAKRLGRPVFFPESVEHVIVASQGKLTLTEEKVTWKFELKEDQRGTI